MLFTATTLKDSPENVAFFVAANLASGVDHMFVFLDAPGEAEQREVAEQLRDHPHVTLVPTRPKDWWQGHRPPSLNTRQRINANWARAVLAPLEWAEWLFHVDGDEVACLDRRALAEVPTDVAAVWLEPWEAVSQWHQPGRPTRFKRLLDEDDLTLLHVLEVLGEPSNQAYFHGHVMGKSGVRPGSGHGLTLHDAVGTDGRRSPRHEDPRLHLLHYDAPSGEEFVRKWTALAQAGPARYRRSRQASARAIRGLVRRRLPDELREKYLRRLYELTTRDDVETLSELGLLRDADPTAGETAPRDLPAGAAEQLAARVEELGSLPKGDFLVRDPDGPGAPGGPSAPAGSGPLARARRRLAPRR